MPLVVPGVTAESAGDKTQEWSIKLSGKKLDELDKQKDLPENHRVIKPGQMVTKDFKEDRLNVEVNEDGVIHNVYHG